MYELICLQLKAGACDSQLVGIHWEEGLIWNLQEPLPPGFVWVAGWGRRHPAESCGWI